MTLQEYLKEIQERCDKAAQSKAHEPIDLEGMLQDIPVLLKIVQKLINQRDWWSDVTGGPSCMLNQIRDNKELESLIPTKEGEL